MTQQRHLALERGATAIVVVIFTVLLLVTISVGFIKIMNDEQRRSSDDELSQAAYDTALSGVEDGKRVLAACQADPGGEACRQIQAGTCRTVTDSGIVSAESNGEVYIKSGASSDSGKEYEQAYTCVKINPSTSNYQGSVLHDSSSVVALQPASGRVFDKVTLSWFTRSNAGGADKAELSSSLGDMTLPQLGSSANTMSGNLTAPPLMRVQLMQFESGALDLAKFDQSTFAHTVYLYPKRGTDPAATFVMFDSDTRNSDADTTSPLYAVRCNQQFGFSGGYACRADISVPSIGDNTKRVAYLRISAFYKGASFSVEMKDGATTVPFYNVQPIVDSTGRAGDVFRRVQARVELEDAAAATLYPRATVDTTNDLCKVFSLGTEAEHFSQPTDCRL